MASGQPLRPWCRKEGHPSRSTLQRWIDADPVIAAQFARAGDLQQAELEDQNLEIADDSSNDTIDTENGPKLNAEWVARSKLRVHVRDQIIARRVAARPNMDANAAAVAAFKAAAEAAFRLVVGDDDDLSERVPT